MSPIGLNSVTLRRSARSDEPRRATARAPRPHPSRLAPLAPQDDGTRGLQRQRAGHAALIGPAYCALALFRGRDLFDRRFFGSFTLRLFAMHLGVVEELGD